MQDGEAAAHTHSSAPEKQESVRLCSSAVLHCLPQQNGYSAQKAQVPTPIQHSKDRACVFTDVHELPGYTSQTRTETPDVSACG